MLVTTNTNEMFDVISLNHSPGSKNILSPMKTNIDGHVAVTPDYLFDKVHEMMNAIRGRDMEFNREEVLDHIFIYNISDVAEINTPIVPFDDGETYNT